MNIKILSLKGKLGNRFDFVTLNISFLTGVELGLKLMHAS